MAQKRGPKVPTTQKKPAATAEGWGVRLDFAPDVHERIKACAKRRGLPKTSYCRMAVMTLLEADENRWTGGRS
jgi:hypothetical protein